MACGDYFNIGSGTTCYPYSLAPCVLHVPATEKHPACPSPQYPSPRCAHFHDESDYSRNWRADRFVPQTLLVLKVSHRPCKSWSPMTQRMLHYLSTQLSQLTGVHMYIAGRYLGGQTVTLKMMVG